MAKTFDTAALRVHSEEAPELQLVSRYAPEAASQTFKEGWPLKWNGSGFTAEWVNASNALLMGFALSDGQDDAAAGTSHTEYVRCFPWVEIEGNLLEASAADHVVVAADLGANADLLKGANLLGTGVAGWYLKTAASNDDCVVFDLRTSVVHPTVLAYQPAVGDTNARVRAHVLTAAALYY
jgi:hypothetical protein